MHRLGADGPRFDSPPLRPSEGGSSMPSPETTAAQQAVINGATGTRTVQNYIGGGWGDSDAKQFSDVMNPAPGELIARVPLGTATDVDRAVQPAATAVPAGPREPVRDTA